MAYINPKDVVSPRASWRLIEVLHNAKAQGWSVVRGEWEGRATIGIRWNGDDRQPGVGTPQSRGNPTWFLVPDAFHQAILDVLESLKHESFQVHISRPDGYDPSVRRLEIVLSEKIVQALETQGFEFHFIFSNFDHAWIHSAQDYLAFDPQENRLGGKFNKDGRWIGDLYIHPEKFNEDYLKKIIEELTKKIDERISKYAI